MIRVKLRIPLDPYSFIEIEAKASNPLKIMESLEAMVKAMRNKTATAFWDKYFRFSEKTFISPGEKKLIDKMIVEKTIVKSPHLGAQPQPIAPMDATDKYNYLNKNGIAYTCNTCRGLISWDKYPDVRHPIHVDKDGQIIGDGSCPDFG